MPATDVIALNKSGAAIPAYGIGQLIGTTEKERNLVDIDYAADVFAVAGPYVVAGPFGCGSAATERVSLQSGRVLRILTNAATVTAGARWHVQTGDSWALAPNAYGQFIAVGADNVATNTGVFFDTLEPALWRDVKTDATIADNASGTCSVYRDGTDTTVNITVHLKWANDGLALAANQEGFARFCPAAAKWFWMGGACEATP